MSSIVVWVTAFWLRVLRGSAAKASRKADKRSALSAALAGTFEVAVAFVSMTDMGFLRGEKCVMR